LAEKSLAEAKIEGTHASLFVTGYFQIYCRRFKPSMAGPLLNFRQRNVSIDASRGKTVPQTLGRALASRLWIGS
jgi:hypothetical protein